MFIYPTEFNCDLTNDELSYIRKGLFLLKASIEKNPKVWKNNGKDALDTIEHILNRTETFI